MYTSGFNLLTVDKIKAIDPEGGSAQGWFYPEQKLYNMGLSARF